MSRDSIGWVLIVLALISLAISLSRLFIGIRNLRSASILLGFLVIYYVLMVNGTLILTE